MNRLSNAVVIALMLVPPLLAQDRGIDLKKRQGFLELVAPIITKGELEIYNSLPDIESRRYFEAIFWYKRDDEPGTVSNNFRKLYYERRQIVAAQFNSEQMSPFLTDRGLVFLLLGAPDDVEEQAVGAAGLRPGRAELWHYRARDLHLRFVFDGLHPTYVMADKEQLEPTFEKIRNGYVLDRAEPYRLTELPLTLPYIGFTKDIENLASEDKFELDFALSYSFFKGDDNRTELWVGFTPRDGSGRGIDINLSAYDPFGEKTREFKKLVTTENGRYEFFSMTLEPDQYTMVLRLIDKDGRESIDRRTLDVPAMRGGERYASGLLLAKSLADVPLYGFLHPKRLVYDQTYVPVCNDFTGYTGERLYANQIYYNFPDKPEIQWFLDAVPVAVQIEHDLVEGDTVRRVVSLPIAGLGPGEHELKSLYVDEAGDLVAVRTTFALDKSKAPAVDLLAMANQSDAVTIIQPSGNNIAELDKVVTRVRQDLKIEHMYLFLNGQLILEREKAPWELNVDQNRYSITGKNRLSVVFKTDKGLLLAEKELEPLEIKERYGTRLVQIYFNAFDQDLHFLPQVDANKIKIEVNGKEQPAKEIKKVDDPITFCFLVDVSYSMRDTFDENISALKKFIESMRPQDRGYFVTFSNKYQQIMTPNLSKSVLLAVAENLKLDKANPKYADRLYDENETYLYDAVIASIHSQIQYAGRSVVLLVSDGIGVEGIYRRNGMLSYARENETVIYSLWLDNNPKLTGDDTNILQKEMTGGEKFARKIGLARFFANKDARKIQIGNKVRNESITAGMMRMLAEESGGFHYQVLHADRAQIKDFVDDIGDAVGSMYVATLSLPVAKEDYQVDISSTDETVAIRNKSKVKVSKTNPLLN